MKYTRFSLIPTTLIAELGEKSSSLGMSKRAAVRALFSRYELSEAVLRGFIRMYLAEMLEVDRDQTWAEKMEHLLRVVVDEVDAADAVDLDRLIHAPRGSVSTHLDDDQAAELARLSDLYGLPSGALARLVVLGHRDLIDSIRQGFLLSADSHNQERTSP